MYRIDDRLKEFCESALATVVGTTDAAGKPAIIYGSGLRIRDDRSSADVFVDSLRADQTLANLGSSGRIAVTFANPVSYRSAQLKGHFLEAAPATVEEMAWVRASRDAFLVAATLVGESPQALRSRWQDDVIRLAFVVEQAFDQTPGPGAGTPL
ncbi:MAG: hypothetical protein R3C39_06690 [Dehalococcoidia bacterium]